jgi:glutathione S-transferase
MRRSLRSNAVKLYYTHNLNPRVAVAVARHLRSPVEYIRASPRDPAQEEAFRPINPNTLCPVLVEEGGTLWETDAIACRLSMLANSDFWRSGDELPQMIMWISWGTHHLTRAADPAYFDRVVRPGFSDVPGDQSQIDEGLRNFEKFAGILDHALSGRDWLVSGRLSYADFRVATSLPFADAAGLPLEAFANLRKWHGRLMEIDAWRDPFAGLD